MKSFTRRSSDYGIATKNTSSGNLTQGDIWMDDEYRHIAALRDWPFLHRARTLLTTAATQFKPLPYDIDQVESVFVTVSTFRYTPKLINSREQWDILNQSTYTSDFPEYAYVYNGELGLWPVPATSANVVTVNGKIKVTDLNTADITSTTITTLANASQALTVSAGLTTQMGGFWIRPTFSTVANTGDGQWYEIGSVASATAATLVRPYGGASIAAGTAASTISQMMILPEPFHDLPIWKAAATYWALNRDDAREAQYTKRYDEALKAMLTQYDSLITDPVVDDGIQRIMLNPNLTVFL